jgi:hypothetical protein
MFTLISLNVRLYVQTCKHTYSHERTEQINVAVTAIYSRDAEFESRPAHLLCSPF